jgi:4-amino-4-deoxy-L-arabinose transferase-like glycosyltransferase
MAYIWRRRNHPEGVDVRQWRRPAIWTITAILSWSVAGAVDRTTRVEVYSDGGRLHLAVAGTDLSSQLAIETLTGVEIRAMDSIDPPRGRRIVVCDEGGELISERLPRRFRFSGGTVEPVGDWEIDEFAGWATVWRRPIEVTGPFSVEATFGGRFHHDLEIVLRGEPTASVAVRRGLINHDAFIRAGDGKTLAFTSIDPTPLADIGAICATVLRAVAVATLLLALFAFVENLPGPNLRRFATRTWASAPGAAALAAIAAALSIWVARSVLEGLPHLPDSVSYLLQARWILDGGLWGAVSPFQEFLDVPYTYAVGDRWLPHYPPGWPFLLSIGLAIGAPWLVGPVLGAIFIVLLYLTGRELDGPVTGILAAVLGTLSPLARLIFGSLLSHAASATLLLAAVWLFLLARRKGSWRSGALGGIAVGLAFGIRPLTTVATAIPLAAVLVADLVAGGDRKSRHRTAAWFLGGALAALPTLVANHLITGHFLSFPYSLAGKSMYLVDNLPFGIRNLDVLIYSAGAVLHGWGWPQFHGTLWVAMAFAFALVPFITRRNSAADMLLALIVVSVAVAHLGSRGHGLHGFGPRYLFEIFAPLFLLTARGFFELARPLRRVRGPSRPLSVPVSALLFMVLCATAAVSLPKRLSLYRGYNGVDGSLERQVVEAGVGSAVVLLPTDRWQGWGSAARMWKPDPEAEILFIEAEIEDPKVWEIAGGRPVFAWRHGQLKLVEEVGEDFEDQTRTRPPDPGHPPHGNRENAQVATGTPHVSELN